LAVVVEPTMGALSDRAAKWWNSRLPFIVVGVIVAAATFILVPVLVIVGPSAGIARWLLPLFLTVWALAMATFRSPSLFLLKKCTTNHSLPQAAAVITVLAGLFAAIRPFSTSFILSLGPLAAFTMGSGGLLVGVFVLRQLLPDDEPDPDLEWEAGVEFEGAIGSMIVGGLTRYISTLALIFGVGFGGAWSLRFATATVSKQVALHAPGLDSTWLLSLFFFLMMGAALPLGAVAARIGNQRAMLRGCAAAGLGLVMIGVWSNSVLLLGVLVLVLIGVSVITTGAVPFALSLMPSHWGGLGIGMYFGGFTLAISGFHAFFSPGLGSASPTLVAFLGAGSFFISWLCISASRSMLPYQKSKVSPLTALFASGAIVVVLLLLGWFGLT